MFGVSLAMYQFHLKSDTNHSGLGWRNRYWKAYQEEYIFLFATVSFMWEKLLFRGRQLTWIMFCIIIENFPYTFFNCVVVKCPVLLCFA